MQGNMDYSTKFEKQDDAKPIGIVKVIRCCVDDMKISSHYFFLLELVRCHDPQKSNTLLPNH